MNSHDRRKFRRKLAKAGKSVPAWATVRDLAFEEKNRAAFLAGESIPLAERIAELKQEIVHPERIVFVKDQVVRLNTDKYGKSYFTKKTKALVLEHRGQEVMIQLHGRKTPLTVLPTEIVPVE